MSKFTDTQRTISRVREQTDTAVLFYSAGGKDGIALLHMLAKTFPRVICYFMWTIKDLPHFQPYIKWAESFGNVEVRQMEHYGNDAIKKVGLLCPPDSSIKIRKIGEVEKQVIDETGIPFIFNGMKGTDGFMKRMRLKMWAKDDYISPKGIVYPLAVWTNKEVLQYIEFNHLIKPFIYSNGSSRSEGFGLYPLCLKKMRDYYPDDWRIILREYPLAENMLIQYEKRLANEREQSTANRDKGNKA